MEGGRFDKMFHLSFSFMFGDIFEGPTSCELLDTFPCPYLQHQTEAPIVPEWYLHQSYTLWNQQLVSDVQDFRDVFENSLS